MSQEKKIDIRDSSSQWFIETYAELSANALNDIKRFNRTKRKQQETFKNETRDKLIQNLFEQFYDKISADIYKKAREELYPLITREVTDLKKEEIIKETEEKLISKGVGKIGAEEYYEKYLRLRNTYNSLVNWYDTSLAKGSRNDGLDCEVYGFTDSFPRFTLETNSSPAHQFKSALELRVEEKERERQLEEEKRDQSSDEDY